MSIRIWVATVSLCFCYFFFFLLDRLQWKSQKAEVKMGKNRIEGPNGSMIIGWQKLWQQPLTFAGGRRLLITVQQQKKPLLNAAVILGDVQ